jgi:hypothetical protein
METQNNKEQHLAKSQTSLQTPSGLTPQVIALNIERIQSAFPALPSGFYKVFCERIKAHRFKQWELVMAVGHVIDTCKYPTPTIAEFICHLRPNGVIEPIELPPTPEEEAEKQALIAERDKEDARKLKEWEKFLDEREAAEEALERERNRDVFAEEEAQALKSKKVR